MAPLAGLLALALLEGAAAHLSDSLAAIAADDECLMDGGSQCALVALQRRAELQADVVAETGCHDALPGEVCHNEIMWAKNIGMKRHPEWYPGLTASANNSDIQQIVHASTGAKCPRPCVGAPKLWCAGKPAPKLWAPKEESTPTDIKVLSYNLFWWSLFKLRNGNNNSAGKLIQGHMHPSAFDVMGFQECEDGKRVLEPVGLLGHYEVFLGTHAICMAYNTEAWKLIDHGEGDVAEDMPTRYYGKRGAQWMRLQNKATGLKLFFINHHGPLSINSGGECGGQATAHNLLDMMARNAQVGDTIVLVGDFNANAGSLTVQSLWANLVQAFVGDSFGGVDNIFTNADQTAVVLTEILGSGGSDHNAISTTIKVPAPVTAAEPAQVLAPVTAAVPAPAGGTDLAAQVPAPVTAAEPAQVLAPVTAAVPAPAGGTDLAAQVLAPVTAAVPAPAGGTDLAAQGGAPQQVESLAVVSVPDQAVKEMTGSAKPGYDWQSYWCGLMEANVGYTFNKSAWTTSLGRSAGDPDRCCRACQAELKCQAWIWKDYSKATRGNECVLSGTPPVSKKAIDGFVSGLAYTAAAQASNKTAVNALTTLR